MKQIVRLIAIASIAGVAQAASAIEFNDGIFHYNTLEGLTGEVEVSLAEGKTAPAAMVIPNQVTFVGKTYEVTHIALDGFRGNTEIEKVTLPSGLTSMEWNAFHSCSNLKEIELPATMKLLVGGCFTECTQLQGINLPEGLTDIGPWCFHNCHEIKEVTIPNSVDNLGDHSFMGVGMTKLVIGTGVEVLEEGVFGWCQSLADVTIPESITEIGAYAFQGCAFTSINIKSPEAIGSSAFANCDLLTEIKCEAENPPFIVESSFMPETYNGTLSVPDETAVEAYKADALWGKFAKIEAYGEAGINDVIADVNASAEVFNLQGIRVAASIDEVRTSGLYICGGKKILVK